MREWVLKEPGHLVLSGTVFAVRYQPEHDRPFAATKHNVVLRREKYLISAQRECTDRYDELAQMGVA